MVPKAPLVSICVLVLSDAGLAIDCLDSLANASRRHEVETVVVANGTPVEARNVLEQREDIVLVRSGINLGFAGGNNLAAQVARGQYLLFLNDDSILEEGYIDHLLATLGRDRSIGAVGGRILSVDGSLQEAGSVLWKDGSANHVGLGLPAGAREFSYVRDVDYVSANGLLMPRAVWDTVGGFDERYFPAYYEDVDLCMAVRQQGQRVVYEPRARLFHLENQSTSRRFRKFLLVRNRLRFVEKWSAELAGNDRRPRRVDEASIDHAIHRARGAPPRLLVVTSPADTPSQCELWDVVEALAGEEWAVTVSSETVEDDSGFDPDRPTRADRLTDLGVDVRVGDIKELLAEIGTDFEAVVVGATSSSPLIPIIRPDGTEVPVIRVPPRSGDVRPTLVAVTGKARRTPEPSNLLREDRRAQPVNDQAGTEPTPRPDQNPSSIHQPDEVGLTLSDQDAQTLRELRFAKADIEVKNEYIISLEARPVETIAFLRAKVAAFGSLVAIWLKVRMSDFRGKSKR
jgi:GT2 family glycosyltransferase